MKRAELFDAFRDAADDQATPYLWSDAEVQRYLDDAVREASERALLIHDRTTSACCTVNVIAGTASYTLHDSVPDVLRAQLDGEDFALTLTSTAEMDREQGAWTTRSAGTPRFAVIDPDNRGLTLRLSPTPSANATLRLAVARTPLASVASADDEPEIPRRHHLQLVDWMLYLAYSKPDSQAQSDTRAKLAFARFDSSFGPAVDARTRRTQRDRAPSVVQFREF